MQDESGFLFENDTPEVTDSDEAILAAFSEASRADETKPETAKGSFKNLACPSLVSFPVPEWNLNNLHLELRLNFPTVGKDQNPAALLSDFLDVLGRKQDSLEDHLVPRIATH